MTRKKIERFTTPIGIAHYPRVNKPDTAFSEDGEFKCGLILPADVAKPLIDQITAAAAAYREQEAKENPKSAAKYKKFRLHETWKVETNDAGEETGNIIFGFKRPAVIRVKKGDIEEVFKQQIAVFDAKGQRLEDCRLGGGSKVKISFSLRGFKVEASSLIGVRAQLEAVQVIELKEYSSGSNASRFGFGAEEGYTADSMPVEVGTEAGGDENTETGNGDF